MTDRRAPRTATLRALALASVLLACGCASHPPEPIESLPAIAARVRSAPAALPLTVAVAPVQRGATPTGDPSREGEAAAYVDVDAAALTGQLVAVLRKLHVFEKVVTVPADRALDRAFAQHADLLLTLRIDRAVARFAGLNGGLYAINWLNWFMFWFPSWWVADERYALELEATLEVVGVRSEQALLTRTVRAEVERSLDDLDRGLTFLGLPYVPGALDDKNLQEAASVLAPYVRNRVVAGVVERIDRDLRPLVASGEAARRDATEFALLVGVSRYRHYALHNVRFAAADAQLLRMALLDARRSPRVPPRNVALRIDERATAASIEAALQDWIERARPVDCLVVYFAGYAAPGPDGDVWLLPYDHDPETGAPVLSVRELSRRLAKARAGEVVVLVDAGLGGGAAGRSFGVRDGAAGADWESAWTEAQGRRRVLAAACGPGEGAYEVEDAGHGLFTFHLVQALREDAKAGWAAVLRAAGEAVRRHAALEGVEQGPRRYGRLVPEAADGGEDEPR
ncbi:MAG: hypothetical protein D6776_11785 [Planctomycetota bacterium]|nr:MAG: hypothetical protein D6776_11785 [Planctomycetota bacterium]